MSKTLGAILTAAGTIAQFIPGGRLIGAGLLVVGAVSTALDQTKVKPQTSETSLKPAPTSEGLYMGVMNVTGGLSDFAGDRRHFDDLFESDRRGTVYR